ncbi:hypothetical protein CVT25_004136 [Psilocybe cyanescens]|uniref:Inhibitor of growth protein N-terminal histone-binding domain-containing protein n=1 Tax=Psilocybe cyanescens TaxID=93625 RepID=A0A409XKR9_PSICY|nr:hypothetical protein CVT25_004136 [Psilocybe cyanescens]
MNVQVPNFEEAANVATEFIYSIDNLPSEVAHLLQEIRHCEARTQDLQQEIDKDSAKYVRYSRRASSASASATPPSPSSRAPSPKSVSIPAKIAASYTEIQELAAEKCVLATRLIEIISQTRAKLDNDIMKVRTLQGDSPEVIAAAAAAAASKPLAGLPSLSAESFGAPGRNPALAISESLRNALSITPVPDPRLAAQATVATSPSPSAGHATKKRRITATQSIKISPVGSPAKHRSASPTIAPAAAHVPQKSRLSRQVQLVVEDNDQDMDADGDEEADAEEDNEDETLYCFCQKQSYGDFHLACVGLKQPTPEKWYCSACIKEKGLVLPTPTTASRKGRKK